MQKAFHAHMCAYNGITFDKGKVEFKQLSRTKTIRYGFKWDIERDANETKRENFIKTTQEIAGKRVKWLYFPLDSPSKKK